MRGRILQQLINLIRRNTMMTQKMIKPVEKKVNTLQTPINRSPINKDSIEGMTRENDKMVIGTFVNIECPGQTQYIAGQYYKGMQFFGKVFKDNEKCTIPLSVARWINERFAYDKHKHILDDEGNPLKDPYAISRGKFIIEGYVT